LVGYDKVTDGIVFREQVPVAMLPAAKKIAQIAIDDDTQWGDWELKPEQAKNIAGLIKVKIDTSLRDFFLEPYVYPD
jgi:hypothetical protein